MIQSLTHRLSDAFLILQVRDSERTTAQEVQAVQQELNEQLGGIYGNLTTELLRPYLERKLMLLKRAKLLPQLPKNIVMPTVVAGLNGVGRGQDRMALMEFATTVAQTLGPEMMAQYINPQELLKRFAASSGIEALGLLKSEEQMGQEKQQAQQQQMQQELTKQAGQLAKTPMAEQMLNQGGQQNGGGEEPPTETGEGA